MATNSDSFTYSNGELESVSGGVWKKLRTGGQVTNVNGNQLQGTTGLDSPYYYNAIYASAAVFSEIVAATLATGIEFSIIINVSTDQDAGRDYNILEFSESGGSYNLLIGKIVNGSFGSLATKTGVALSNGDTLRFENDGSGNFTGYINGVAISGLSATDTDNNGNVRVGFMTSSVTAGERFDNWQGGDLAVVAGGSKRRVGLLTLGVG